MTRMDTFMWVVALLCCFIIGAVAGAHQGRPPVPVCQEDEVYIGGGNFTPHKGWDYIVCGPARDDIEYRTVGR